MGNSSRLYRKFEMKPDHAIPADKIRRFSMGKLSSATNFQCDIIPERHKTLSQPEQLLPFSLFPKRLFSPFLLPSDSASAFSSSNLLPDAPLSFGPHSFLLR